MTGAWLLLVLGGALACNAVPHLANGLSGQPFPTPFARPSGVGPSSPAVNALWGAANLVLGAFLLWRRADLLDTWPGFVAASAGFVAMAVFLAWHFGRVRRP